MDRGDIEGDKVEADRVDIEEGRVEGGKATGIELAEVGAFDIEGARAVVRSK